METTKLSLKLPEHGQLFDEKMAVSFSVNLVQVPQQQPRCSMAWGLFARWLPTAFCRRAS